MSSASTKRIVRSQSHRLKRMRGESPLPPDAGVHDPQNVQKKNAVVECGWGRLIFGRTFETAEGLAETLRAEKADRRDIAFYVQEPQVVLAQAPQELFLDPSHTYRLDLATYRSSNRRLKRFFIRRLTTQADAEAVNVIYAVHNMVHVPPEFFWSQRDDRALTTLVAEDSETGEILGTVTGVDHRRSFGDLEAGSSLWCLAVSPQAPYSGIGEGLVRRLAEVFMTRGAAYMDLSVLHTNEKAMALYEKLGFRRVPVFAVKRRNTINETLYTEPVSEDDLNPYARIIVDEARRRGIQVDVTDAQGGFFCLTYGGRSVDCRESLSDFTSAVAMSICDDKRVTRRTVEAADVKVPALCPADTPEARAEFLSQHASVVVKPARGEQGRGIAVGVTHEADMERAVENARRVSPDVVVEECFDGEDLRIIVIDYRVVAAALRRPARVVGDGKATVIQLIEERSKRRAAATGGESTIPMDGETERCVAAAGYRMDDILAEGVEIAVRKAANLHTGGTIHDVTGETHPVLVEAAIAAARAINIPVTGIDLMVKSPRQASYVFIEANERPGLANHEPQPTAERFIDLLFPLTIPKIVRQMKQKASP